MFGKRVVSRSLDTRTVRGVTVSDSRFLWLSRDRLKTRGLASLPVAAATTKYPLLEERGSVNLLSFYGGLALGFKGVVSLVQQFSGDPAREAD